MLHYATTIAVLAFIAFIAIIIYAMCVVSHRSDNILENYDHVELSQEASSELEKVIRHYEGEDKMIEAGTEKNLERIAKFKKVSFEQFKDDLMNTFESYREFKMLGDVNGIYDNIKLPTRSTSHSAGYDISIPYGIELEPGETIKIPTGIRCYMDNNYVMLVYVRSSVGIKKRCVLLNGTGVIDSDYYNADNEGHMFIALKNDGDKPVTFEAGDRICQAVFVPFGITVDDNADGVRTGGIGSTN